MQRSNLAVYTGRFICRYLGRDGLVGHQDDFLQPSGCRGTALSCKQPALCVRLLLCLLHHLPVCAVPEELEASKEEEGKELWQADWDDADTSEDFQAKLKQELDRDMKD